MPEIGETLREARMRARIDVSEIEAQTKIRAKYLRALENEEWSLLPGPTFVKSFLRTYAQALGLDAKALVEEYRESYEDPSDALPEPIVSNPQRSGGPGRPGGPSRVYIGAIAVITLVIVLLVVGLLSDGGGSSHTTSSTSAAVIRGATHAVNARPMPRTALPRPRRARPSGSASSRPARCTCACSATTASGWSRARRWKRGRAPAPSPPSALS